MAGNLIEGNIDELSENQKIFLKFSHDCIHTLIQYNIQLILYLIWSQSIPLKKG